MTTDLALFDDRRAARRLVAAGVPDDVLEAFGEFLRIETADGAASPRTLTTYYAGVATFVEWCVGAGVRPAEATEGDVKAWRAAMVDAKVNRDTIRTRLSALRRFYLAMVWRGLRADNPAAGVRPPRNRTDRAEAIRFLDRDFIARLLVACPSTSPTGIRDRALVLLFGLQGPRVAEVAALNVADVDLIANPPQVVIREGKGDKQRRLYLSVVDAAAVAAWLKVRAEVVAGMHAERPGPFDDALFVTLRGNQEGDPGRRMTARAIRHRVDRALVAANLKREGVSCHSLRHSFATWSAVAGVRVETIAANLGHSNVATTSTYVKVADRIVNNPAAALEQFFGLV